MSPNGLAPDLQKSLINTFYLTFTHNYIPIAYFGGILISLMMSIYKPSRFTIFLLLGFTLLLFGYEYDKHIVAGLREQTLNSIATEIPHYKLQRIISLIISDLLPIFLYLSGWLFVYIAIIYGGIKLKVKSEK